MVVPVVAIVAVQSLSLSQVASYFVLTALSMQVPMPFSEVLLSRQTPVEHRRLTPSVPCAMQYWTSLFSGTL
jgi:hypothetical protein